SGAIAKAEAHDVELYTLKPWTEPMWKQFSAFQDTGPPRQLISQFQSHLLYWVNERLSIVAKKGPPSFTCFDSDAMFEADGSPHTKFATYGVYKNALLLRSTEILCGLEPAQTISRTFPLESSPDENDFVGTPAWPHTHTLDLVEDRAFLKLSTGL